MVMDKSTFKSTRQQKTNISFCKIVASEVAEYCNRNKLELSTENTIAYLVKHNLLRQSAINAFVCVRTYPKYLDREGGKEKAVFALSNLLPLEPRQIYNLLGNGASRFRPNRFRFI